MAIRREDVERVAELARLELEPGRVEALVRELSAVIDFVGTLSALDLEGAEPGAPAGGGGLRDDAPDGRVLEPEQALAMAPERDHDFFLTPPIVENVEP